MARAVTPRLPADHIARVPGYLRGAAAMMAIGLHEQATSNAYYAAFHAAHALLATAGVTVETHAGLQQALSLHFVRDGPLPGTLGRAFGHLMTDRALADYGLAREIDGAAARQALANAAAILGAILPLVAERSPDAAGAVAEALGALAALDAA